uniref:Uncharacterized protein n=2 Tax=Phlebotomus papatasi TaxID=29031 RepID=A0A1B0DHY0_PHLPP
MECHKSCQKYIYRKLYDKMNHLSGEFQQLENRQTVILIITLVLLILFLIVHGLHFLRWLHRRGYFSLKCVRFFKSKSMKQKQCPVVDLTHANPNTQSPKLHIRTDLARNSASSKRDSTIFSVDGSTIQTVSTPVSTRYPAEDSTLDYSYDNRGMTVTPVADKPRGPETNF